MKIQTQHCTLGPVHMCWSAIDADTYDTESGAPIGFGANEADAIVDLLAKMAPTTGGQ